MIGYSKRFAANGSARGQSGWLFDGTTTAKIGLYDAEHTNSVSGERYTSPEAINEAGQATGTSSRYGTGGVSLGTSVWIYTGGTTTAIGLTDAEHTSDGTPTFAAAGYRSNQIRAFNESGVVAGVATRFSAGSSKSAGQSAWLYNGSGTTNIGLVDSQHTNDTTGFRNSDVQKLNENGQAAGIATRFAAGGVTEGQSAWFYDGATTQKIGVEIDTASRPGAISSGNSISILTDSGLVGGLATVSGWLGPPNCEWGPCEAPVIGSVAWFFNGATTVAFDGFGESVYGQTRSMINFITDDGLVLGNYDSYDESNSFLGRFLFAYTEEWGVVNLDMLIDDSWDQQSWLRLSEVIGINGPVFLYGNGVLADGSTMGYQLTAVNAVPLPPAVWLFGSALAGLGWLRRKQAV